MMITGLGGPVVHLANEETIVGHKMFSVSIGVNGIRYSWPHENLSGVLCNDGEGNLAWRELAGVGTVTEVGLIAPNEFLVGEPVRSAGNLTFTARPQQAFTVYAGPVVGVAGRPTFRKLAPTDLPSIEITKVAKLPEALDSKADVALITRLREEVNDGLARKVEMPTFTASVTDLGRQLATLERSKADQNATFQAEAKLRAVLGQKIERAEFEKQLEAIVQRLDHVAHVLNEKVSTTAPEFKSAATVKDLDVADGSNLQVGHNKGTKIASTRHQKIGFYGLPPVPQPSGDVITALANLGLIKDPSLWMSDVVGLVERLEAIEQKLGGE